MSNFLNHLKSLIQLAIADQSFHEREKDLIFSIGKANGVYEQEINELIDENLRHKGKVNVTFSALSFEDKFEYLYNIVQLMKIDNEVYLSEVIYCQKLAEKLGFKKRVIKELSARIYSDPKITTNHDLLIKEVKKYELK